MADLPEPEQVFGVPRIGARALLTRVLGPSMIALGVSIGSGEWLLGPLAFATHGFAGLGWLITVSAALQTLYNMECARYTLATGEVPAVGFTRIPPGLRFWAPFTLAVIYLGWGWGGWVSAAGQAFFTLLTGRTNTPQELGQVRAIAIAMMVAALAIVFLGRKVARTLELFNTVIVAVIFVALLAVAAALVPAAGWASALGSFLVPGRPPEGIDVTLLGAIVGYTGFGAGMNFMLVNYYRDKGYAMGHRVGYIAGLRGGGQGGLLATGVTFADTALNRGRWRRWLRFLALDQWLVFFPGAILGMLVPSLLVAHMASLPGAAVPDRATMPTYLAEELARRHGPALFYGALALGALTLFKTQGTLLEMLVRNTSDVAYSLSPRFRTFLGGDPRRFYYPFALVLVVVIGAIIHVALPVQLLLVAANMANFASLVFPLAILYLNRRLPPPARSTRLGALVLWLNVLFFGFFFVNFLAAQVTGQALVRL